MPDAIASVARQRHDVDLEHLVFDGGSTDGSREWLRDHLDLGYRVTFEPDLGQSDALSRGFREASGDLFGWLNADDLFEPGALLEVAEAFRAAPDTVMISGACLFIDAKSRIIAAMRTPPDPSLKAMLRARSQPPQPSTFFRASAYRAVGGLDTTLDFAMDLDLWLRLAGHGQCDVLPDRVLARYRVHPGAKSERSRTAADRQDLAVRRRAGMRWRSAAGLTLIREGYITPVVRPIQVRLKKLVRRVILGSSSGHRPA